MASGPWWKAVTRRMSRGAVRPNAGATVAAAVAGPAAAATDPTARQTQHALHDAFTSRCAELGLAVDPAFFWYHTIDPLAALASAATQCRSDLIIGQTIPDSAGQPPLLTYVGGAAPQEDRAIWWIPNLSWFQIVLKRLGFSPVEVANRFTHTVRPAGNRVETTVLRARRGPR